MSAIQNNHLIQTYLPITARTNLVRQLTEEDRQSAITLLSTDRIQGVVLRSFIEDYGVTSASLRGNLYGYFEGDLLTGIALIGHQVLFFAPDTAIPLFAKVAVESGAKIHLVFCSSQQAEIFCKEIAQYGYYPQHIRDLYWFVCHQPRLPLPEFQMQQATLEHLEVIEKAHAEMLLETNGYDPRERDAKGFRLRIKERIERGRTWIKVIDEQIVFKADLQSMTPDAIYLEGIWTNPQWRSRGIAKQCMIELTHRRLGQDQILCLVVEASQAIAQHIYQQVGFERIGNYQARYIG